MARGAGSEKTDRVAELEQRIEQLEWQRRAGERSRAVLSSVVPEETRQHMRAAWREQLLAVRSLVDHWIGRIGEPESPRTGREEIKID